MSNVLLPLNGTLTQSRLRDLLLYEPHTGRFSWLKVETANQCKVGDLAGSNPSKIKRHPTIKIDGRAYRRSRLAWLYMTGEWPSRMVDHRDRDPSNDRWANLRLATNQENIRNSNLRRDSASGVKGVYRFRNGRWAASIRVDKKLLHLGYFDTIEEAAAVRRAAEIKHFGEFAPSTAQANA
jgi:hypothetical protein